MMGYRGNDLQVFRQEVAKKKLYTLEELWHRRGKGGLRVTQVKVCYAKVVESDGSGKVYRRLAGIHQDRLLLKYREETADAIYFYGSGSVRRHAKRGARRLYYLGHKALDVKPVWITEVDGRKQL